MSSISPIIDKIEREHMEADRAWNSARGQTVKRQHRARRRRQGADSDLPRLGLRLSGTGLDQAFDPVPEISDAGEGVERAFPIHSPQGSGSRGRSPVEVSAVPS